LFSDKQAAERSVTRISFIIDPFCFYCTIGIAFYIWLIPASALKCSFFSSGLQACCAIDSSCNSFCVKICCLCVLQMNVQMFMSTIAIILINHTVIGISVIYVT